MSKVTVKNTTTQTQVLALTSGEILTLPPRGVKTIDATEVSADVNIKVSRGTVILTNVPDHS